MFYKKIVCLAVWADCLTFYRLFTAYPLNFFSSENNADGETCKKKKGKITADLKKQGILMPLKRATAGNG